MNVRSLMRITLQGSDHITPCTTDNGNGGNDDGIDSGNGTRYMDADLIDSGNGTRYMDEDLNGSGSGTRNMS